MAKKTRAKESHASPMKKGMGDYYGSGIKQKSGKPRDSYMQAPVPKDKLKSPPKSLA